VTYVIEKVFIHLSWMGWIKCLYLSTIHTILVSFLLLLLLNTTW